jgi:hypothetical protein
MKKFYVSPLATEVKIEAEQMLATSFKLDNENRVDTEANDGSGQLSAGHRGEWGNLWGK